MIKLRFRDILKLDAKEKYSIYCCAQEFDIFLEMLFNAFFSKKINAFARYLFFGVCLIFTANLNKK